MVYPVSQEYVASERYVVPPGKSTDPPAGVGGSLQSTK